MKKLILFLIINLLFIYSVLSNDFLNDSTHYIFVSINGDDNTANGSKTHPFRNIQSGINYSTDGDIVLVLEGRYTGQDNRNLDFKGKSITVQSEFPNDNTCLNNTIIDAEGIGFVLRFINDERINCIFQGFSIVLGDTSLKPIKGIPGFIEFSKKANPITRRLKIISEDLSKLKSKTEQKNLKSEKVNNKEIYLNNPFVQPINTTDYYGSGDVDKDGELNYNDIQKIDSILNGFISPNIRADINGNGIVDYNDLCLIDSAINHNKILPAWWNKLSTEDEKNNWIDKIIKIDKTNELTYTTEFDCDNFSHQLHLNGFHKYYYGNYHFDGSQTIYNLPIFEVMLNWGAPVGHGINAILIGDDPLNFDDWRFIEPQTDYNVSPGMWSMPYNSYVSIAHEAEIPEQINFYLGWVVFKVNELGWILERVDNTILENPSISMGNNFPYLYNPRILPNNSDQIFYEKERDDMTRIMDIHISNNPNKTGVPLTNFNHYSRILDVNKTDSTNFNVLWASKTDENITGVYYGLLNADSLSVSNISRISDNSRNTVSFAKILSDSNRFINTFWYNSGIWHTKKESDWNIPVKIVEQYTNNPYAYSSLKNFDVVNYHNNSLVLTYIDHFKSKIEIVKYSNNIWEQLSPILSWEYYQDNPSEITSVVDSYGIFHIVYKTQICCSTYKLFHIYSSDLINWSNPIQIDADTSIQNPSLLQTNDNKLVLVYEKEKDNHMVPVWRKFSNETWSESHYISVRQGANATYTDSYINSSNQLLLTWAAQAMDSLKIESFLEKDLNIPVIIPEIGIEITNSLKTDYFIIYPNPVKNTVVIESNVILNSRINISIYQLTGKLIYNNKFIVIGQKFYQRLDLSNFECGVYFIKLQFDNIIQVGKLILE